MLRSAADWHFCSFHTIKANNKKQVVFTIETDSFIKDIGWLENLHTRARSNVYVHNELHRVLQHIIFSVYPSLRGKRIHFVCGNGHSIYFILLVIRTAVLPVVGSSQGHLPVAYFISVVWDKIIQRPNLAYLGRIVNKGMHSLGDANKARGRLLTDFSLAVVRRNGPNAQCRKG